MTTNLMAAREAFRAGDYDAALSDALALLAPPVSDAEATAEAVEPVEVWLLLAAVWQARDRLFESEVAYRKASALLPDRADIRLNLAAVLRRNGLQAEAENVYRQTVVRSPRNIPASLSLIEFLSQSGHHAEAIATGENLLASGLEHIDLRQAVGNAYFAAGQFADALAAYQSALVFAPQHQALLYSAALSALQAEKPEAGVDFLERLLALQPDHVFALLKLASVLAERGDDEKCIEVCSRAADLAPGMLEPQRMLADALVRVGRPAQALQVLDQIRSNALAGREEFALSARLLEETRQPLRALACLQEALGKYPQDGVLKEALISLKRALCDWDDLDLWGSEPPPANGAWTVPEKTLRADGQHWARRSLKVAYLVDAAANDHLFLETLSALLNRHTALRCKPVLYVMDGPLGVMPSGLEVCELASSNVPAAVQRMTQDKPDLLVLAGRVRSIVRACLNQRVASLQITWQTAPTSTPGADYVLADPLSLPFEAQAVYSEAPIWFPVTASYVECSTQAAQIVPIRPLCGLPAHGFVFAAHCRAEAIDPETFTCWMKILRQIPGSVLWLQVPEGARENLLAAAERSRMTPDRLVFADPVPLADHLARLRHADLYLVPLHDTLLSGASYALWAGLPVLARRGEELTVRPAISELCAAGMERMLVEDAAEYIQQAVELARDRKALQALRYRLSEERQARDLFDSAGFVHGLERALHTAWLHQAEGGQPLPVEIIGEGA